MRAHREWILGSVVGSGVLFMLSLFTGGIGAALHHFGDEIGTSAACVTAGVLAAGFLIMQILLVTLLALAFLEENIEGGSSADRPTVP